MATAEQVPATTNKAKENVPAISAPRLPYHPAIEERFQIDRASWKALVEAIFPNAVSTDSVILALSYCRARKLDPFKRNVHIVPIYNSQLRCMVDTVWPGIGELRTTAFRTGHYAGRGETKFGQDITRKVGQVEMTFPEWAQVTLYRMVGEQRVEFAGPRVYWLETYAVKSRNDDSPNSMWADRPRGQIDKCAEAAALRAAFPEEIGDYIPEEVQHASDRVVIDAPQVPHKPTLDSLTDKFTETAYVPPTSEAVDAEAEGVNGTDAEHQGEHIEDVNQSEAPDPFVEFASENHPLRGLPTMLRTASTLGEITKAKAMFVSPDTEAEIATAAEKLCETAREIVRNNRGGRSSK